VIFSFGISLSEGCNTRQVGFVVQQTVRSIEDSQNAKNCGQNTRTIRREISGRCKPQARAATGAECDSQENECYPPEPAWTVHPRIDCILDFNCSFCHLPFGGYFVCHTSLEVISSVTHLVTHLCHASPRFEVSWTGFREGTHAQRVGGERSIELH
jgi:hypothetical protein